MEKVWSSVRRVALSIVVFGAVAHSDSVVSADEATASGVAPAAVVFDELLAKEFWGAVAPQAEDGPLLRRLYLTLVGVPPTLDELDAYQADSTVDRYQRVVDDLLQRAEFVEHWGEKFDVMLMERRPNTHIPQDQWTQWLRDQIAADRPLHELFADLLVADGAPGPNRPASRFLLDRGVDPHLITRDIGRIYFGRDLQCAQCHDHPAIDSYLQTDYHGLLGFVSSLQMQEITEGETKLQMVAEKSPGDAPFESVFRRGQQHRVLPHLFTAEEFSQPWTIPGEDYHPQELANRPLRPLHSRRGQLAEAIRSGSLDVFNRTLANRLWQTVLGRGLIEPVDFVHAENPPISEALLVAAAEQLVTEKFSLRRYVRHLVMTDAFRRGSLPVGEVKEGSEHWIASAIATIDSQWNKLEAELVELRGQVEQASDTLTTTLDAVAPLQNERLTAFAAVDTARTACTQAWDAFKKTDNERVAADLVVQQAKDKIAKLGVAVQGTSGALQALGEDAELAAAVELLKTRLATAEASLPPLEQALNEKTAATQVANDAYIQAKTNLQGVQGQADVVNTRYQTEVVRLRQARIAWEGAAASLAKAEARRGQWQMVRNWADQQQQQAHSQAELATVESSEASLRVRLTEIAQQLELAQQQFALAESEVKQASLASDELQQRLRVYQEQSNQLNAAKESINGVSNLVISPEKIVPVVAELEATMLALQDKRGGTEQELVLVSNQLKEIQRAMAEREAEVGRHRDARQGSSEELNALALRKQEITNQLTKLQGQQAELTQAIADVLANRFQASRLLPLTPEQMGWSFLAANGVYRNYVDKHLGELEKETPATAEQQQDNQFQLGRRAAAVRRARAELQGNINVAISLYGAGPGQPQTDFFATADQALYVSNGGAIFSWAAPSGLNVAQRVHDSAEPSEAARILYRGILCRAPSDAEVQGVESFLNQLPEQRARLVQEMVWGLMVSAEFRFLQ
jgi:hypothetical protein